MNRERRNEWLLCPSKTYPGQYYFFNAASGEAIWKNEYEEKFVPRNSQTQIEVGHGYPEPSCPPNRMEGVPFQSYRTPEFQMYRAPGQRFIEVQQTMPLNYNYSGPIYRQDPQIGPNVPYNSFGQTMQGLGPMFIPENHLFQIATQNNENFGPNHMVRVIKSEPRDYFGESSRYQWDFDQNTTAFAPIPQRFALGRNYFETRPTFGQRVNQNTQSRNFFEDTLAFGQKINQDYVGRNPFENRVTFGQRVNQDTQSRNSFGSKLAFGKRVNQDSTNRLFSGNRPLIREPVFVMSGNQSQSSYSGSGPNKWMSNSTKTTPNKNGITNFSQGSSPPDSPPHLPIIEESDTDDQETRQTSRPGPTFRQLAKTNVGSLKWQPMATPEIPNHSKIDQNLRVFKRNRKPVTANFEQLFRIASPDKFESMVTPQNMPSTSHRKGDETQREEMLSPVDDLQQARQNSKPPQRNANEKWRDLKLDAKSKSTFKQTNKNSMGASNMERRNLLMSAKRCPVALSQCATPQEDLNGPRKRAYENPKDPQNMNQCHLRHILFAKRPRGIDETNATQTKDKNPQKKNRAIFKDNGERKNCGCVNNTCDHDGNNNSMLMELDDQNDSAPVPAAALRALSDTIEHDVWYIVPDVETLLRNFQFLDTFVQMDEAGVLLIPSSVKSSIDAMCRGECEGRGDVMTARRVSRRLADPPPHIQIEPEDPKVVISYETVDDSILECCQQLIETGNVVLVASNEELYKSAVSSNINCFTVKELKDLLSGSNKLGSSDSGRDIHSESINESKRVTFDQKTSEIRSTNGITQPNKNIKEQRRNTAAENKPDSNSMESEPTKTVKLRSSNLQQVSRTTMNTRSKANGSNNEFPERNLDTATNEIQYCDSKRNGKDKPMSFLSKNEQNVENAQDVELKTNEQTKSVNACDTSLLKFLENSKSINKYSIERYLRKFSTLSTDITNYIEFRMEEYVTCFCQIMDEYLSEFMRTRETQFQPPWKLYEILMYLEKHFDRHPTVRVTSNTLCGLMRNLENDLTPAVFMKIFGCGILLIKALRALFPESLDMEQAYMDLEDMLKSIENPSQPCEPDPTPTHEHEAHAQKQNSVRSPKDLVKYLKEHFESYDKSKPKEQENTHKDMEHSATVSRTTRRNASLIKTGSSGAGTSNTGAYRKYTKPKTDPKPAPDDTKPIEAISKNKKGNEPKQKNKAKSSNGTDKSNHNKIAKADVEAAVNTTSSTKEKPDAKFKSCDAKLKAVDVETRERVGKELDCMLDQIKRGKCPKLVTKYYKTNTIIEKDTQNCVETGESNDIDRKGQSVNITNVEILNEPIEVNNEATIIKAISDSDESNTDCYVKDNTFEVEIQVHDTMNSARNTEHSPILTTNSKQSIENLQDNNNRFVPINDSNFIRNETTLQSKITARKNKSKNSGRNNDKSARSSVHTVQNESHSELNNCHSERIDGHSPRNNGNSPGTFEVVKVERLKTSSAMRYLNVELRRSIEFTNIFIKTALEKLSNDTQNEIKKMLYEKSVHVIEILDIIIKNLKRIVERDNLNIDLNIRAPIQDLNASKDTQTLKYRGLISQNLEDFQLLHDSLKIIVDITHQ